MLFNHHQAVWVHLWVEMRRSIRMRETLSHIRVRSIKGCDHTGQCITNLNPALASRIVWLFQATLLRILNKVLAVALMVKCKDRNQEMANQIHSLVSFRPQIKGQRITMEKTQVTTRMQLFSIKTMMISRLQLESSTSRHRKLLPGLLPRKQICESKNKLL